MAGKTLLDHKHQDKKFDEIHRKLDDMISSNYEQAITYLKNVNSLMYNNSDYSIKTKRDELVKASDCFIAASSFTSDVFMQAKAMVFTGVCYELRGIRECARDHYGLAYNKGNELWQQKTEEIKKIKNSPLKKKEGRLKIEQQLLDFDQFMEHLRDLVKKYPSISTSGGATPLLLPQFSRMEEIASSSTTHDRITIEMLQRDERLQNKVSTLDSSNQTLQYEKRELQNKVSTLESEKRALESSNQTLQREKQALESSNQTLQREKRELESSNRTLQRDNQKSQPDNDTFRREKQALESSNQTLQREKRELESEKQTLTSRLNQALQAKQELEKTIRDIDSN
jgi:hypothetical protein